MSSTSAKICGTGANKGSPSWTGPGNITANDSSFATRSLGGGGAFNGAILSASNFGFTTSDIPSGATILGILVEISRKRTSDTGTPQLNDVSVKLSKNNTATVGSNYADTSTGWPTTEAIATYGGTTDLWGTTWADTDLTSSNFSVWMQATNNAATGSTTANVNFVRVTIYYSSGGATLSTRKTLLGVGR